VRAAAAIAVQENAASLARAAEVKGGIPNESSGVCVARLTMTRRALSFIEEHNPTTLMVICVAGPKAVEQPSEIPK
jgi:hypothetical protein